MHCFVCEGCYANSFDFLLFFFCGGFSFKKGTRILRKSFKEKEGHEIVVTKNYENKEIL